MHDTTDTATVVGCDETGAGPVVACSDGSSSPERAVESSQTSFNCFGTFGGFGVNFRLGLQLRRAHSTTEVSGGGSGSGSGGGGGSAEAVRGDESPPYSPTVRSRASSPTNTSGDDSSRPPMRRTRSASVGGGCSYETPSGERLMEKFDEWWRRRQQVLRERRKAQRALRRRRRHRATTAWTVSPAGGLDGCDTAGGAAVSLRPRGHRFVDMIGDDILTRRWRDRPHSDRRIAQQGIPGVFSGTD